MKFNSQDRQKHDFDTCCREIEGLIEKEQDTPTTLQNYTPALGVIALHRHHDTERADKILAHVQGIAENCPKETP